MAVIETWYNQDLQQPVKVHYLDGSLFSHNGNGNRIGVHVFNNGEPVTLSGTVSGYVVTADGSTVPCTGSRSGQDASILIPAAAYQPGAIFITVFLKDGSTVTTLASVATNVLTARTGNQVSPGSVVADWTQTINGAMQDVQTAAANLGGIVATPYASLTYPVPLGKYTYYNGNLYRCISAIAASEEFTAAHWTQVRLGNDVTDLKSAFNQVASNIPNLFTGTFDESGYINPQTGANADNANYKRTKDFYPVKIVNGNKIYFKTSATTPNMQIVVYNSNKSAVQATASRNNVTAETSITIIEDGYFRLYTNASYAGNVYVGQMPFDEYGTYSNYKIPIEAVSKEIKEPLEMANLIYRQTGKNIFDVNSPNIVIDHYLDTSGNEVELSDWNISDYIDVEDINAIVGSVFTSSGSYYIYCKLNYMHTYDSQKNHIGKVWDQSTNGVYSVTTGVSFVRFCWKNNETADNRKIMIEEGTEHSQSYEPYALNTYLTDSAYPTTGEVQAMIESGGTVSNDVVCWGDSLTYSQYNENITYPQRLANLANVNVFNFGMPGASSMDISGLQGGMPMYIAPFTLPASDWVEVTFIDCNGNSNMYFGFLHYSLRTAINVSMFVEGIEVLFAYAGNNVYRIKRKSASASAKVFERPIKFNIVSDYTSQINIFWVGTNDAPTTAIKAQRTIDIIKNMVSHYGRSRYLILGLTVKSYADATNDLMGQTFGNHYVDVKDYLIKYGLADSNLTPTAQDTADINNGIIPTSLRHDSVHFNDYGYTAVGNCVYQHGKDLGYWE